ncbi:hypothetical protein SEA_MISCHIEF19_37 [Streptomyces phage Mischief19]|nr:hypothetical protein SEA_MISCHIEF19_37 [Streptomyces phage Mischief19]
MSTTNGDGEGIGSVALELERLRGEVMAGFARISGQIENLDAKHDRTVKDVEELDKRVTALEERRWPVGLVAALSGTVSAGVAAVGLLIGVK